MGPRAGKRLKMDSMSTNGAAATNGVVAPPKTTTCDNYINGKFVPPSSGSYVEVRDPSDGSVIGSVAFSTAKDVEDAVASADAALEHWSRTLTIKARASILLKFHSLVTDHADELSSLIVSENGKNLTEARAELAKGLETVEYAVSLPQLAQGKILRVSSQVMCQDRRDPLGLVVSIVPFNFPFMVPMWTIPIALVLGNCVILKPSEKVPLTMRRVAELLTEAGVPPGVFQTVNGPGGSAVEALVDSPSVKAVTFVGSSPVAELVSRRCNSLHKRSTCLGGAKNHLVALEDCDVDGASKDIVVSYAGCAGQRCMAASVLLVVGDGPKQSQLLRSVIDKAGAIKPGTDAGCMGPVIDNTSYTKILRYIEEAEKRDGAEILLDGRATFGGEPTPPTGEDGGGGCWIGPTIIRHKNPADAAMTEEVFGPVLSVYTVKSWEEAIDVENSNPFGNAACVYTTAGGSADWFLSRFRASMLGVNVGIPVPREPFSFGGLYGTRSKFGDLDITGDGAVEFFTNRVKVTTKWPQPSAASAVGGDYGGANSGSGGGNEDQANFAGRM